MIRLALRSLRRRRGRTSLTILGVTVAIAFTVGILSISEGFITSFNQSIEKMGEDILVLPEETASHPMPMMESYGVTFPQQLVTEIQDRDDVKAVYPVYTRTLLSGDMLTSAVGLNGVTPAFLTELRPFLKVEQGRLLKEGDQYVVVVGSMLAQAQELSLGSQLEVRGENLEVIGIFEPSGSMEDMLAYAPIEALQELFDANGEVTLAAVTVKDVTKAAEIAQEINDAFPGVAARTLEEVLGQIIELIGMARAIHFSVASIALIIGTLFVFSTMLMAVSERVKEIGTMRAIGASRRFIFRLIVSESIIIGLIAGVIGCFGGYLLSKAITYGISQAMGLTLFEALVTPRIVGVGLLIALIIGTLAGLYPAWRISKINIVEALRYE